MCSLRGADVILNIHGCSARGTGRQLLHSNTERLHTRHTWLCSRSTGGRIARRSSAVLPHSFCAAPHCSRHRVHDQEQRGRADLVTGAACRVRVVNFLQWDDGCFSLYHGELRQCVDAHRRTLLPHRVCGSVESDEALQRRGAANTCEVRRKPFELRTNRTVAWRSMFCEYPCDGRRISVLHRT